VKIKIKASKTATKDIFTPDKESLKTFIRSKGFKVFHNFQGNTGIILGADHDVESVLSDIDKAERVAIFTNPNYNMGHSLSLILNNKLECYDIGIIKETFIEVIK
jgi:hypothetical protein